MTTARRPTGRQRDLDPDVLLDRLAGPVRDQLEAELRGVVRLTGGQSSLTYRATLRRPDHPDEGVVIKAAPPGLEPVNNRDVLRQARVLEHLAGEGNVPVPLVTLVDAGDPPDIPPLFLMTFIEGDSVEPIFSTSGALPAPEVVRGRALSTARTLAALHDVSTDPAPTPEPPVDIASEIARWERTLSAAGGDEAGDRCLAKLRETAPTDIAPTLVHGDFRTGNCLFVGDELTAVIDWEIWALSDPRIDLAWLALTAMPDVHPGADREPTGMPAVDELLDAYSEQSRRRDPTAELDWFVALALYKMAAMSRHIAMKFEANDPRRTGREAAAGRMLAGALARL